jgi:hypothetical protein
VICTASYHYIAIPTYDSILPRSPVPRGAGRGEHAGCGGRVPGWGANPAVGAGGRDWIDGVLGD